jgi:CheY-like chemotaxis protein
LLSIRTVRFAAKFGFTQVTAMSPVPANKLKVLVVDNQPQFADTLALVLSMHHYDVKSAHSASQAIQLATASPFDFLLSDVVLDGEMSGIDLAIEIRKVLPNCNVLLISGDNATGELLKQAQARGYVFDCLPKPIHPTVILDKLKSMQGPAI